MSFILDASALLAYLRDEPGAREVENVLSSAVIGAVNFSEVVAKLVERGLSGPQILDDLNMLQLDVRPFDARQARLAGLLRRETSALGLSLGDRACLALARVLDFSVLERDRFSMKRSRC